MVALPITCPTCGAKNYYYSKCKTCEGKQMAEETSSKKPAASEVKSSTFWVIETGRTTYWDGRHVGDAAFFTDKIDDAVKFYDFESAERIRCWLVDKDGQRLRSVEHGWM